MKKRHFNMLELIIVVVCLGVVAGGMVIPVMIRKRHKVVRRSCPGNLKQIGLALLMYSGEYNGYFPPTPSGNNFEPLHTETILNDGKVYDCPAAAGLATTARFSSFEYGGSGLQEDFTMATTVTIARDQSGNHPGNQWMNVLFADGRVEGAIPDGTKGWNTYQQEKERQDEGLSSGQKVYDD